MSIWGLSCIIYQMSVQSIALKNYRSYESAGFEFGEGVTIIIGPNASGKTNLLEAVYVLCQGKAFRVSDKDLIAKGSTWARVDMIVDGENRLLKLVEQHPRTQKSFEINSQIKPKVEYGSTIPVVLFEPDDSRIVGGSPERRRDYLDTLLCSISAQYKTSLGQFKRALKQRNNLLKSSQNRQSIFAWNVVLARHAADIHTRRHETITDINTRLVDIYSSLAGKEQDVSISYQSSIESANYMQTYLGRLERGLEHDIERGYTGSGPHRDDFVLLLGGKEAGTFASRGEARSLTLSLKIIEMILVEQARGHKPLLLLDDVFSELDGLRRRKLTEYLSGHQSIITTTDADVVGKKFASLAAIISLESI
jgi:DNA replication and repair protein RecF